MPSTNGENVPGREKHARWTKWWFPVLGLVSLVWFLIRVVPKPSRAAYPCQRLAFPLASGFVIWLTGLLGSVAAFAKAKRLLRESRRAPAGVFLVVATAAAVVSLVSLPRGPALADDPQPLVPIGEARGIHPGRVVWVHDPAATDWEGPGRGHWWESRHTNQRAVARMMGRAIVALTGEPTSATAWDRLFRHFNDTHGRGDRGYQPGEKIVVKVNLVGAIFHPNWGGVNPDTYDLVNKVDYMNTSPQMIIALLRQLVKVVGVDQADIVVGDPLSYFPNQYYDLCHKEFPNVRYLDYAGRFGRTRVERSSVPLYWSNHPQGIEQDYLPRTFAEADYLINMANLKSHDGLAGVTLCAKNHYGSLIRWPAEGGYYDLHADLPINVPGMGHYRPLVDLLGHAHLGGKTLLYLIDGLYAGRHAADDWPIRWSSSPFHGDWTSSLFASQDPVAIDSVGLDFLRTEWDDAPHWSGTEDYLHEAALAHDPPSTTFYDPDHSGDVTRIASLGVYEHWNNARDKHYSRNLGTGDGIELVAVRPAAQVAIDLGSNDVESGITHPQKAAARTVPATIGGRECRRNRRPHAAPADRHFYFAVDDGFAYRGSRPELYVTIDYFDTGSGSLRLQYDSDTGGEVSARYRNAGRVMLEGTGSWRQHTFHLTDAYFGNRQNLGADFRITKTGAAQRFYLDLVQVSDGSATESAIMAVASDPARAGWKPALPARAAGANPGQQYDRGIRGLTAHEPTSSRLNLREILFLESCS
ncbi:MAG: DUF362 domain-containing protein [bacterium]|nr:DUF362 domain-containing protein [bacterium]